MRPISFRKADAACRLSASRLKIVPPVMLMSEAGTLAQCSDTLGEMLIAGGPPGSVGMDGLAIPVSSPGVGGAADIEGGSVAGPHDTEEEDQERRAILLSPKQWHGCQGEANVDEGED